MCHTHSTAALANATPGVCFRPWLVQAYVRCKPEEDSLTISLILGGRQRNLNRCGAPRLAAGRGQGVLQQRRQPAAARGRTPSGSRSCVAPSCLVRGLTPGPPPLPPGPRTSP